MAPPKPKRPSPTSTASYWGYPEGAQVPTRPGALPGRAGPTIPLYQVGQEWNYSNVPPDQMTAIQKALISGGYADSLRLGVWGQDSAKAMAAAMGDANRNGGMTVDQLLSSTAGNQAAGGRQPQSKAPRVLPDEVTGGHAIEQRNTMDLQTGFIKGYNDALGYDPTPEEQMKAVAELQAQDVMANTIEANQSDQVKKTGFMLDVAAAQQKAAAQNAMTNAENAGGSVDLSGQTIGGHLVNVPNQTVQAPASPQAYAEMKARTEHSGRFGAAQITKRLGNILDLMSSSGYQTRLGGG